MGPYLLFVWQFHYSYMSTYQTGVLVCIPGELKRRSTGVGRRFLVNLVFTITVHGLKNVMERTVEALESNDFDETSFLGPILYYKTH